MSVQYIINAVLDALGIPHDAPPETVVEVPKAKLEEVLIAAVPAPVVAQAIAKRKPRKVQPKKSKPKTKPRRAQGRHK